MSPNSTPRRWKLAEPDDRSADLAQRLKTSELIARILLNRGIADSEAGYAFLRPTLKSLHEPAAIHGLAPAAERVARAIRDGEQIVIYGDYDVDGITASAILWHAITLLGGKVRTYVPHRIDEGYGLNAEAVKQLCDEGAKLIITVDCGITAIEPVDVARNRGVDVVITDHHEWKEGGLGLGASGLGEDLPSNASSPSPKPQAPSPLLPNTQYIVHPRLPLDAPSPNPHICGSGVAFKLAWGIGQAMAGSNRVNEKLKQFLVEALALAALGTIADVVPLVGENRIIAHFGLVGVKNSKLIGIQALIASAGLTGEKIDSFDVGFKLGPRLNAAGRMGHARLAVEMLTTAGEERAAEIAEFLEAQNRERQQTERTIVEAAVHQIENAGWLDQDSRALVVGGLGWHPGVIGIVASRLVDRFHRPSVVIALDEDLGHGSGRSIDGFHLSRALEICTGTLVSHGGHEMAAGLKLQAGRLEEFREMFVAHAAGCIDDTMLLPTLRLDAQACLASINESLVTDFARLGPFGRGNPKPVLCCHGVTVTAPPRRMGKTGDHLQLYLKQNGTMMRAVAWGAGDWCDHLQAGSVIDLAVEPRLNEYNGNRSVELEVKDLKLAE